MKLSIPLFCLLLSAIMSCSPSKKNWTFTKENVSFTGPGDWTITDRDDLNGAGYYVSVEKNGFTSSGLYILTWVNQIVDPIAYLDKLHNGFVSRKELQDVKFETTQKSDYNGNRAISSDFSFRSLNVKHKGTITIFSKSNKTYSVTEQWAIDDEPGTQDGFQLIESTFKLK